VVRTVPKDIYDVLTTVAAADFQPVTKRLILGYTSRPRTRQKPGGQPHEGQKRYQRDMRPPWSCCIGAALYAEVKISIIVCAHNEEAFIGPCLASLLAQTRMADEILVVNNASTDRTGRVARLFPGVRVIDEPRKGLVVARERGRAEARGDVLVYLDADCRAPLAWLERIASRFADEPSVIALSGNYRFYDWDWLGRALVRAYDVTLGPATHVLVKYILRIGVVFYGGNFAVRRTALEQIGGFDTRIEFHGEDTNVGRRLAAIGNVELCYDCFLYTSARRYNAMGKGAVFRLYVRNFVSELLHHRPKDTAHLDIRQ
jgi:glycosyltransferase involved in cell wall biosynthesis